MGAGKRLHRQVNSLVAFQIVVSVEALGALVTLEWPVVLLWLRMTVVEEVRHACSMSAIEALHHVLMDAAH